MTGLVERVSGMSAHRNDVAALRREIALLEGRGTAVPHAAGARFMLGHGAADKRLGGGLERGTLHEVIATGGADGPSAAGFGCGLSLRAAAGRPIVWVRQDFSALENGDLFAPGLLELGLDVSRLIVVQAPKVLDVLSAADDALSCRAVGALVVEFWGEARDFDLTAGRKLQLAAGGSGVTAILMRVSAQSRPSAAQTRWVVRPASSRGARTYELGHPAFDAELVRARNGATGRWLMEWNADHASFAAPSLRTAADRRAVSPAASSLAASGRDGDGAAHPVVALSPPRHRPGDAAAAPGLAGGGLRRAG